jgi:hypothetical protein
MCQNANKTVAALMAAIEPTLKSLLTFAGIAGTTEAQAAIAAYDAALTAVQNWQSGTTAQNVLELIGDFQTVFASLPLPPTVEALTNIILAGIETVIGVLTANSPAPAAPQGTVGAEEQGMHQAAVAADTVQKVHALVPGIKLSRFHAADVQYKKAWNDAVASGGFPETLKAA